jgi:5-methyltetrahydropteroyltriglutamate--homocysteine methyltransferase
MHLDVVQLDSRELRGARIVGIARRFENGGYMATVLTTHTGSLHRPPEVEARMLAREREGGEELPAQLIRDGAAEIVRAQADIGIDVLNDGEVSKPSYATYVKDRLTGIEQRGVEQLRSGRDVDDHPDFAAVMPRIRGIGPAPFPSCVGPVQVRDETAVQTDIANLLAAASAAGVGTDRLFMSAASPGVITHFVENLYYPSREEFLAALAVAMRHEYKSIIDAGITLQVDCPDFAMSYNNMFKELSVQEFRNEVALGVEALNTALEGLPAESVRVHLCWGNGEAPHTHDIALRDIIDLVLGCHAAGISVEAANPRHGHEWEVFNEVRLPDDRYLIPGVIDSTTNFVEHPELIAQRIDNYVRILGAERVVAGTDCGFGTSVGRDRVVRSVAWAKLAAMVEGARIASTHAAN